MLGAIINGFQPLGLMPSTNPATERPTNRQCFGLAFRLGRAFRLTWRAALRWATAGFAGAVVQGMLLIPTQLVVKYIPDSVSAACIHRRSSWGGATFSVARLRTAFSEHAPPIHVLLMLPELITCTNWEKLRHAF